MALVNRVNGFRPVGTLSGGSWSDKVRRMYHVAGSNLILNVGDIVGLSGTADADGVPGVLIGTAGSLPCGVIVGIEPQLDNLKYSYMPAATNGYVFVCVDPFVIMETQASEAIAAAEIGCNADLVQTTAAASSTTTSGQQLDGNTTTNTSTLVFNILGLAQRPDNTLDTTYNKVLVTFNVHQFKSVGTTAATE